MACEKCWGDAYLRMLSEPSKSQAEHYQLLLDERKSKPCTREEELGCERGHNWKEQNRCDIGGNRTEVVCTRCGMPGERNDDTEEVFLSGNLGRD